MRNPDGHSFRITRKATSGGLPVQEIDRSRVSQLRSAGKVLALSSPCDRVLVVTAAKALLILGVRAETARSEYGLGVVRPLVKVSLNPSHGLLSVPFQCRMLSL